MEVEDFLKEDVYYEPFGQQILTTCNLIADIRGWGAIQQLFKKEEDAARFQDELGKWIADAINQKLNGKQ